MYARGAVVEVEWYDAADEADGWQDIDAVMENPPKHKVKTVGYYLGVKDEHLYLTPTMKDDQYAVLSIIPEGCIIKITLLTEVIKYEGPFKAVPTRPESVLITSE